MNQRGLKDSKLLEAVNPICVSVLLSSSVNTISSENILCFDLFFCALSFLHCLFGIVFFEPPSGRVLGEPPS